MPFTALGLERFVGLRYLHRARRPRGARATLVGSVVAIALGFAIFFASRGRFRAGETIGVLMVLAGALGVMLALMLQFFSVFTTVSTMGVVLGVASLVVVLGVTSGFE